jgi:hypothetical protein
MSWFSADERETLRRLADILIPAAEGMPAASAAGAADDLLDTAINVRPDFAPLLLRAARASVQLDPALAIAQLSQRDGEAFAALGLAISAAYYMSPAVLALLRYPGPTRRPFDPDAVPDFVTSGLLSPVLARGAQWRFAIDRLE